jgi:hypothetical protein
MGHRNFILKEMSNKPSQNKIDSFFKPVFTVTTKPASLRASFSKTISDDLQFVTYSILLTIAVHYNNINMCLFYCFIIIFIYNMILSKFIIYSCSYLCFLLFALIWTLTNPCYCFPQIVWIKEVLLQYMR